MLKKNQNKWSKICQNVEINGKNKCENVEKIKS